MSKEKNKNIYQKLLVIQKAVNGLGTDSKSFGYKYTSGTKVLHSIKPLMNELGLILKQEVLSIDNVRQDYKTKNSEKSEILSKVMMKFTWIDSDTGERDENFFGANGQNDWEKGLGSALTYAERYFLMKYFHINTDEDDIDNPNRKDDSKKISNTTKEPTSPKTKKKVTDVAKIKTVLDSVKRNKGLKQLREQFELTEIQVTELGISPEEAKGITIIK